MKHRSQRPRDWISQVASLLAMATGLYYLTWRLLSTLNREALWFAIPVWAAEAYGLLASGMFFLMVWRLPQRQTPSAPPGLRVDIFIPTYDEPVWVVRRTVLGALAVRYPHDTYVLDDGNRLEMAQLARELGCRYLAREEPVHAKAGNLNNALWQSSAEVIAILDADHVPLPDFLDRTLGYFTDARVAFVQTPQDFYNVDSYQHRLDIEGRWTWHDQALFFRVIQPGKDRWNAAFFCGSCAVIRRRALDEIGGFATETVTEDLHTSLRLHARGWRSIYHNEILAYGLAPVEAVPYHVQRLRWGQGAMQVFRHDNPLLIRGLTLAQRINYLASMTTYFDGYQKLIFYLAPPTYLLTGILPIHALDRIFILRFALYYASMLLAFKLGSRGHGAHLLTEHYNMVRFYTYIKSTAGLFVRRRLRFVVTPKAGTAATPWAAILPVLLVMVVTDAGIFAGTLRLAMGREPNTLAYAGNLLWSTWHVWLAAWAIWFTLSKVERRALHRARVAIPVRYATEEGQAGIGVLVDLHEEGAGLLIPEAPLAAARVWISFLWFDDHIGIQGEVVSQRETPDGLHVRLRLRALHPTIRDFLATFVILFAQRKFMEEVGRPIDRLGAQEWYIDRRRGWRGRRHLPVRVQWAGQEIWGVTQDVSDRGAQLLFPRLLPRDATLRLSTWMEPAAYEATVVHTETLDLPPYVVHRVGVRIRPSLVPAPSRPPAS